MAYVHRPTSTPWTLRARSWCLSAPIALGLGGCAAGDAAPSERTTGATGSSQGTGTASGSTSTGSGGSAGATGTGSSGTGVTAGTMDGTDTCAPQAQVDAPCQCGDQEVASGWCCADGPAQIPCPAMGCSELVVDVQVPTYDPNDPQHMLIQSDSDWAAIDDPDKRVFFVAPGAYGAVQIASSGTPQAPRIVTLMRDDSEHPGRLQPDEQARVDITFVGGAGYWIVSRLSSLGSSGQWAYLVTPGCHDIVFDRMHIADFYMAFRVVSAVGAETQRVTLQRSRVDQMTPQGIDDDRAAIVLGMEPWNGSGVMRDVHIIENEIRNANDGIQPVRHPDQPLQADLSFPGLTIDCNHIYVDQAVYTDGQGNVTNDPDALWAFTENGIDIKAGSEEPGEPVLVTRNKLWGFRHTDTNGGGSGSWGSAMDIQFNAKNVILRENVVFNASRGLGIGATGGLPWGTQGLVFERNIVADIGKDPNITEFSMFIYNSNGATVRYNTFVGDPISPKAYWYASQTSTVGLELSCNAVVRGVALAGQLAPDAVVQDNYQYETALSDPSYGPQYPTAAEAQLADLTFWTDLYTPTPRQITVPGVVTTAQSPHAGWCGAGP